MLFSLFMIFVVLYPIIGFMGSAVTGRYDASDALFWVPRLIAIPVNKAKQLQIERNRIPTANEVVCGVIAVAVVKHFENWVKAKDRYFSGRHNFTHKQIKITRNKEYSFDPVTYVVTFGNNNVEPTEELKKAIEKSFELCVQSEADKEKYKNEQKLLTALEEYLK